MDKIRWLCRVWWGVLTEWQIMHCLCETLRPLWFKIGEKRKICIDLQAW